MNEPKGLKDYYNYFDIPYDATIEEIEDLLNYQMQNALSTEDKKNISLAAEYLLNPKLKKYYDSYLKRHNFGPVDLRKKEAKRKRVFKTIKQTILIGTIVAIGLSCANHNKEDNKNNNVCIEYNVQSGDSYEFLEENFRDYSIVDTEVTGANRNMDYVYEGDVVVGRTTKEIADKLVEEGTATIISVEQAAEILESKGLLKGEFKDFVEGNSDFVFYVPTGKTYI